jgi:hypothetical protein
VPKIDGSLRRIGFHLRELAGLGRPSLEDFQIELAKLGLLGRSFVPLDYARALSVEFGIGITIEAFPDVGIGLTKQDVLEAGTLAEVFYNEHLEEAVILVRESLRYRPWPAYDLKAYHELSHLAAGHPVSIRMGDELKRRHRLGHMPRNLRLASSPPVNPSEQDDIEELVREVYEPEARRRAKWLVFAGTVPDIFEQEGTNRVT